MAMKPEHLLQSVIQVSSANISYMFVISRRFRPVQVKTQSELFRTYPMFTMRLPENLLASIKNISDMFLTFRKICSIYMFFVESHNVTPVIHNEHISRITNSTVISKNPFSTESRGFYSHEIY